MKLLLSADNTNFSEMFHLLHTKIFSAPLLVLVAGALLSTVFYSTDYTPS